MAGRIRSIKPEILEDERSAGLDSDAWRLWVSMWLVADDYGRLRGAIPWLEGQVFWLWKPRESLAKLLESLEKARLIVRYEVDGQNYIEIRNWAKHQKVDHPGKPRIPSPPLQSNTSNQLVNNESSRDSRESVDKTRESLAPDQDQRPTTNDLFLEPSAKARKFDLQKIADRYPRRKGIAPGLAKLKAVVKTQEDYDAVLAGMERFCAEVRRKQTEIEFLPYFSTWVNAKAWEDGDDLPLPSVPGANRRDSEDLGEMAKRLGLE